jgi:hypothetical protein
VALNRIAHMMKRFALVLTALSSVLLASCISASGPLRLAAWDTPAHQQVGQILADAGARGWIEVPLELLSRPAEGGAPLDVLDRGVADLAIVENSFIYHRAAVRTVVPLYSSVLHIAKKPDRAAGTVRELLNGATVFAGQEGAPARLLLSQLLSLYAASGIEMTFVDDIETKPDIVFVFAPVAPERAIALEGYELFSLGDAIDGQAGSLAEALVLIAPQLRRFVIPKGIYGELTPGPVVTVAVDTLLVAREGVPRASIFDLLRDLRAFRPSPVEMPDLLASLNQSFGSRDYAFPLHSGAQAFLTRDEPNFYERAASILDTLFAVVVGLLTGLAGMLRFIRSRRKDRIDVMYQAVLAIRRSQESGLTAEERQRSIAELLNLRNRAYELLIDEKLAADENFSILTKLIDDVLGELRSTTSIA